MTSPLTAISSITLSISLTLGSTVALAAPPDGASATEATAPEDSPDTGVTAEEKDKATELSEQAVERFGAKDYDGAAALFEQAYELDPNPNYLFNIGRVYEEAGNIEKAVEYYGRFVKQPGVDLESREVAVERLKVLREILAATAEDKPKDEPKDDVVEDKPVEPPPPQPDPGLEEAKKKKKNLRIAGFVVLGAGAGALIGGGVVGALGQGEYNEANTTDDQARNLELLESAQSKQMIANIMFGVGGALALTGVVLVAIGFTKPKTSSKVAVTPSFGPQGGGLELRMRF